MGSFQRRLLALFGPLPSVGASPNPFSAGFIVDVRCHITTSQYLRRAVAQLYTDPGIYRAGNECFWTSGLKPRGNLRQLNPLIRSW